MLPISMERRTSKGKMQDMECNYWMRVKSGLLYWVRMGGVVDGSTGEQIPPESEGEL